MFLMHPSEAVSTGCQLRLHGGVGLAVLISTGERLRSTRAEAGGRGRRERRLVFEDTGRRSGAGPAPLFRRAELRGGGVTSIYSAGEDIGSKWACAPLEGGRVVTKLWAAIHSCDRRVGMIERCVHDVNEDVCVRKDE